MADDIPQISDPFLPPGLILPTPYPYVPPPDPSRQAIIRPLSFYDGRQVLIPTDSPTFQGLDISIEEPALVRCEGILDSASPTGLLQNVLAAFRLELRASSRENYNTDTLVNRMRFHRGMGPLLYLPTPGIWTVTARTGGNIGNRPLMATVFVGIPPDLATEYIAGTYPAAFNYYTEELLVPAAGVVTVPSPAALSIFTNFNWFGMTELIIQNGSAAVTHRIGGLAAAIPGGKQLGINGQVRNVWAQMFGCNVTVFNAAGGSILYLEGRSI